uniref:CUB domain-containing protein n=2 Tax=Anopheles atroparvus TaxID=41427 RepID=A0A182JFX4_ANOAO
LCDGSIALTSISVCYLICLLTTRSAECTMNFPVAFALIVLVIGMLQQTPALAQYTGPSLACGGTSLVKSTNLVAPMNVATNGINCVYTIRALNLRICQLRLDFNSFSLAQPTLDPYPRCVNDVLSIENLDFDLCGENTDQHVYVPFNPTNAARTLTITFRIASRNQIPTLTNPHWSVRVQQLECPTGMAAASGPSLRDTAPEIAAPIPLARTFHGDFGLVAPVGCLQYFTEPTGTVESFNFGAGAGPYLGGLSYAICFQRKSNPLRLRATNFEMAASADPTVGNPGFDELCYSSIQVPARSEDHLHIPNAVVQVPGAPTVRASRFCHHSLLDANVEVSFPGPFMLFFNSDRLFDPFRREVGFRMTYQL